MRAIGIHHRENYLLLPVFASFVWKRFVAADSIKSPSVWRGRRGPLQPFFLKDKVPQSEQISMRREDYLFGLRKSFSKIYFYPF